MRKQILFALICLSLFATSLFAQTNTSADSANAQTTPPIPEEARKHFVKGTTLFNMGTALLKDAKTRNDLSEAENDFKQAAGEFQQAADLAPQWPEARYNLASVKESVGDYSGAIADLKIYQKLKPSDTEARAVQDKIYALEAKAEVAAKKRTPEPKAAAADDEQRPTHFTYTFYDDFSDNRNNWGPLNYSDAILNIENGRLSINALKTPHTSNTPVYKEFPIFRSKDFEIEVTQKWESEGGQSGVVFCSNRATSSNYYFQIVSNHIFQVYSYENDVNEKILAKGTSSDINVDGSANVLKIVARDKSIMFYVNNKLLETLPFDGGFGKDFGVFSGSRTKVQFSTFKLSGERQ
jgi:tetratricopeptide (TPR) repeat protein